MAKVKVVGNAIVVTSELKLEDLKLVQKYRPEALILYGGKEGDEPIFRISTEGNAGINEFGATFVDESRDGQKLATITASFAYDGEAEKLKELIAEELGGALMNIGKLERKLPAIIREINEQKESVVSQIEIC